MDLPAAPPPGIELPLPAAVRSGLALLLQAHRYAQALCRNRWDFAVEIGALRAAGLTRSDLRWLLCAGYVEHGRELSEFGANRREFHVDGGLVFNRRSAFVLTAEGVRSAESLRHTTRLLATVPDDRRVQRAAPEDRPAVPLDAVLRAVAEPAPTPGWDRDRHELRLGGHLVKVFKLPSPNQEIVLAAFEEEGWPPRIDDPLPPAPDLEPKRRLHDTIKSLNRNQKHRLIRFMGDGTGQGIRWLPIDADGATGAA